MNSAHLVILLAVVLGVAALWIGALISMLRGTKSSARRAVWFVVLLVFQVVGPIAWFVGGRPYERQRS